MTVASILMSSHDRLPLFRRALWAIANRPPSVPFELVVVDDESSEDILGELQSYSAAFDWTFVRFDRASFESATGLAKFHNNSAVTQNIASRHARGGLIFQQGNEVIPWADCYDRLLADGGETGKESPHWLAFSTTYDLPRDLLARLDPVGSNLRAADVEACRGRPLQSEHYRSDVTNYVSLTTRAVWESIGGFDERYYAGVSSEDSDFVRRARAIPGGCKTRVSGALSLHQSHGGRTRYERQDQRVIDDARWDEGVRINHEIFHSWDGGHRNPQGWEAGSLGVGEVITNHS